MKNGAELLDRLVKDIVSDSAASYVSVLRPAPSTGDAIADTEQTVHEESPTAFSLERFIPLLEERIDVLNPFVRTFLVSWITLLDSIPDLELVTHLPRFLGGLFKFLSDPNPDVHTMTQKALDRFLNEIRKIARVKRGIAESRKGVGEDGLKRSNSSTHSGSGLQSENDSIAPDSSEAIDEKDGASVSSESDTGDDEETGGDDWIPGQDVQVEHAKILDILVTFLSDSSGISPLLVYPIPV